MFYTNKMANRTFSTVFHIQMLLNRNIKVHLYKATILSVIVYGVPASGCGAERNMKKLQGIQNKMF
jgi:hypothetical protein